MNYEVIITPFPITDFRSLSRQEINTYFKWYCAQTETAISRLARAVRSTSGFEGWEPDLRRASLIELGRWVEQNIQVRPRSQAEIDAVKASVPYAVEVREFELVDSTVSLMFDVGIYFAEVLRTQITGLKWTVMTRSLRFVDYGQPLLAGHGKVQLNPMRVMVTFAYSLGDHTETGAALLEIYDVWAKNLLAAQP